MWSGPRTVSTALMRSWENRPDTVVVDEPLYAFYLSRTGIEHPGRDAILLPAQRLAGRTARPHRRGLAGCWTVFYQKHMTHHLLPEVDRRALAPLRHAYLIRDPRELLASYAKVRGEPTLDDLGLRQQTEIFETLGGPVIEARDLLERPEGVLRALVRRWAFRSMRRCWAGRRGGGTPTACGGLTGMKVSGGQPGSGPTGRRTGRCLRGWGRSRNAACPTTRGCTHTGSGGSPVLQTFDERNRDLLVSVRGVLAHRAEAAVSPFDSAVQGGDAVWEGLRLYQGRIFRLAEHLARLRRSARALAFTEIPSDEEITAEISRTLHANGMTDGVHIRLTLTRGIKITSGMDPRLNQSGPTLIVLAEHKPPVYDQAGITLITSSVRRPGPDVLDPKIHHNNLLTSILAKIEANVAARTTRSCSITAGSWPRRTPPTCSWWPAVCWARPRPRPARRASPGPPSWNWRPARASRTEMGDYSLAQFYAADEVFVTGTMGGLAPVTAVDGRTISGG